MLPAENTSDRNQHHHIIRPASSIVTQPSDCTANRIMNGNNNILTASSSIGIASGSVRRKSILNYHHQYLSNNDSSVCSGGDHQSSSNGGRYSPHPNELFLQHNAKLTLQPSSDDSLSCCLPPPSPAPHNDRFCGNNLTTSSSVGPNENSESFISVHHHHHQVQQSLSTSTSTSSLSTNSGSGAQQHHHASKFNNPNLVSSARPLSPNNRFRSGDRFRDKHSLTPNSLIDNGVRVAHHTPVHTTALSNDTYNYLNASTAHTPVKRYIPTPPPAHDLFTSGKSSVAVAGSTSPHMCTLPYRLRVKCCDQGMAPSAATQSHSVEPRVLSVSDYYTTSPRIRPSGIGNYSNKSNISTSSNGKESPIHLLKSEQQLQNGSSGRSNCNFNVVVSTSPTPASPSNAITVQSSSNLCGRQSLPLNNPRSDYIGHTPNIEYINVNSNGNNVATGARILSPILMSNNIESHGQNSESISASNTAASTCLHCNTTRRTTGVHQTTQTTGPISPVPLQQQQIGGTIHCQQDQIIASSSPITPATSETPLSPMSSAAAFDSQQLRFQQQVSTSVQVQEIPQSKEATTNNVCQQSISHHTQALPSQQALPQSSSNPVSQPQRFSTITRKKRLNQYLRREIACFFGVEESNEAEEEVLWRARQRRLAVRRFGALKSERELHTSSIIDNNDFHCHDQQNLHYSHHYNHAASERPDVLPAQDASNGNNIGIIGNERISLDNLDFQPGDLVERKSSVASMLSSGISFIVNALSGGKGIRKLPRQWSRSFAPAHIRNPQEANNLDDDDELYEGLTTLQEDEVFFDSQHTTENCNAGSSGTSPATQAAVSQNNAKIINTEQQRHQIYLAERVHGWRTTSVTGSSNTITNQDNILSQAQLNQQQQPSPAIPNSLHNNALRGMRISAQLLDGVLENSRRPLISLRSNQKLFTIIDLDDRTDHRPFFTYWINTVHILVLFLSLICYGVGPIGFGIEQHTGQVLVTSLSLQTVQHSEQRNIWIGPRNFDLVHMGAKFATCMRKDVKIMDVLFKTRRQERETACCIRNDDSGCVQSSQADCSVRGLFPTKSISTWKKWSPGESGPGGRISGSVCGLDPKYCDAPASIAPYEWPDDITKWPICRKTNSFSQRFRFKDHTAEHMICEVIGHPCCTGVFGECRITTREYCDFVNGYFHEEASLCSQISCLSNVCGMFPFFSVEIPDQFYRLFTSLCLHAGILHLAITVAFQHVFLADLERLIGPIRTATVYLCSGVAGNLTSVLLVPYKPEVGPLASLTGVVASLIVLLVLMHWKQLRKPHIALLKLLFIGALLFALGTLPWQLNFAGLFAGMVSSVFLTIALVPFVSITSYVRKSKINLIWSCAIFHLFLYSFMLVIFYIFPTELTNLNFGEVLTNTFNTNVGITRNGAIGEGLNSEINMGNGVDVLSSISQSQAKDYNLIFYPENYLVNTAATLQIFDRNRDMAPQNRFHHISLSKDNNNIKNSTNFKNFFPFNNSKKHFSNKNNSKIIIKDNKNSTNPYFFDKERKIIHFIDDSYKSQDSYNTSYLLSHHNKTNKKRLASKLSDFPNFEDQKSKLFQDAGSGQNTASNEISNNQEISAD